MKQRNYCDQCGEIMPGRITIQNTIIKKSFSVSAVARPLNIVHLPQVTKKNNTGISSIGLNSVLNSLRKYKKSPNKFYSLFIYCNGRRKLKLPLFLL